MPDTILIICYGLMLYTVGIYADAFTRIYNEHVAVTSDQSRVTLDCIDYRLPSTYSTRVVYSRNTESRETEKERGREDSDSSIRNQSGRGPFRTRQNIVKLPKRQNRSITTTKE